MNFAYPIQAILMYLSILFAPPEVERITIEMPGQEPRIELVRNGGKWESGGNVFAVEKDSMVLFGTEGREALKITDFIALPGEHDWNKNPKFTLGGGNTLEKVATGFTLRRNAAGGEGNGVYQIRYQRPGTVNVLGEVVNPGVHPLPASGKVHDAIAAAGGPSAAADMKRVSIVRGPAGAVPKVTTVDLTLAKGASPPIQAGDTIHVPASNEVGQVSEEEARIRVLAEQWLGKTDAGEYDASWKAAAEFFQRSITAEAWSDAMKKFREPLGGMKTREIRDVQKADALPGAPDGKYVIIQFDTAFAAKAQAVETVTLMLEKDGSWKPAGYVIR
jgi:hypothetical protein